MAFEALSFRHVFRVTGFPAEWLPLVFLYDADLPLFPIQYFHVLDPIRTPRPTDHGRAFGFIERVALAGRDTLDVTVATNKDLAVEDNARFREPVLKAIRNRLGVADPVREDVISAAFDGPLSRCNAVVTELWHRVVANAYGGSLPFGRIWDEVLGLARFVASFDSPGGRKGELIQTHYFAIRFGERIQCSGDVPPVDFFLLPTGAELFSGGGLINSFGRFARLVDFVAEFHAAYCTSVEKDGLRYSRYGNPPGTGALDGSKYAKRVAAEVISRDLREAGADLFNAFDKRGSRTVLFLLLLSDLVEGRVRPEEIDSNVCARMYAGFGRTYQSPKVLALYAQQCFGNPNALPIDGWVKGFLKWPFAVWTATMKEREALQRLFQHGRHLGKLERLMWTAAQGRKVHASTCNDALWCLKYVSQEDAERGANPFACKLCQRRIRDVCPAYAAIADRVIRFNPVADEPGGFTVVTSAGDNVTPGQGFVVCTGNNGYAVSADSASSIDEPRAFRAFPNHTPAERRMTVREFVRIY